MDDLKGRADACGYAQLLGIEVEELSPGYARTRVRVAPEHQNWMPRTHGALVMSLADHAWGLSFATLADSMPQSQVPSRNTAPPRRCRFNGLPC